MISGQFLGVLDYVTDKKLQELGPWGRFVLFCTYDTIYHSDYLRVTLLKERRA